MIKIAKKWLSPVLLAGLVLFYANEIWRSSKGPHAPINHTRSERTEYEAKHDNILADAWNWTTQDAVSFYTFVLSIFTAVIGVTAIIQIRFLIRAESTARRAAIAARRAANAARKSAEHIPRVERAYIFGDVMWEFFPDSAGAFAGMARGAIIVVTNYGKTPGHIYKIAFDACASIPAQPDYSGDLDFDVWLSANSGKTPTKIKRNLSQLNGVSFIYGRVYYRDIFGDSHSSGFIGRIMNSEIGAVSDVPTAYTEWD